MNVVLKNNTKAPKRMLVFNLKDPSVKVVNTVTVESRDGERRKKVTSKLVPDSIRIPTGMTSDPLPESVLLAPEVARAIKLREIIVLEAPKTEEAPVEAPAPEPPPAPAAETPRPKGKTRRATRG